MKYLGPAIVASIGFAAGWLVWELSPTFTGIAEPWDSKGSYYWLVLFMAGIVASLPSPRWYWLAAVGVGAGQCAFLISLMTDAPSAFGHLGLVFAVIYSSVSLLGGGFVFLVTRLMRKGKGDSK